MRARAALAVLLLSGAAAILGCSALPDVQHEPQFHNPFPQLHRVAVLPFVNQSQEPTLDTDRVTLAYYNELQKLPGFEVKPLGVVKAQLASMQMELNGGRAKKGFSSSDFSCTPQRCNINRWEFCGYG